MVTTPRNQGRRHLTDDQRGMMAEMWMKANRTQWAAQQMFNTTRKKAENCLVSNAGKATDTRQFLI